MRESEAAHQQQIRGNQPGDPAKAAAALIRIAGEPNPPLHLLLGQDAYDMANAKIEGLQAEFEQWQELSRSTDFAEPVAS